MDSMLNRGRPPEFFSPEFNSFPGPSVSKLQNGLNLYCYNLGDQPVFRLELIFRFGSADVTSPSAASIACNMLREGTINKSADEINNLLDYYGSFLDIKAGCVLLSAFFVVTVSLLTTKPTSSKLAAD